MRALVKRVGKRIDSIRKESYQLYIYFGVIILLGILEAQMINVLVNYYGCFADVWYKTSKEVVLLRMVSAMAKSFLCIKIGKILNKLPDGLLEITPRGIRVENKIQLLIIPVIIMELAFLKEILVNLFLCLFMLIA